MAGHPAAVLGLAASLVAGVSGPVFGEGAASAWIDVRLGDSLADVQQRLGDPLRRVKLDDGGTALRYLIHDMTALAFVYERGNRVVAIRIRADDSATKAAAPIVDAAGGAVGDAWEALERRRGKPTNTGHIEGADIAVYVASDGSRTRYEIVGGKVNAILLSASPDDVARFVRNPGTGIVEHDGDSAAHAIVVLQRSEKLGVDWEYVYLAYHPCDESTRWKLAKQALIQGTPSYDRLDVVCPGNGAKRSFFFDITSFFGKS